MGNLISLSSTEPLGLQIWGGKVGFISPAIYQEANDDGSPKRTPISLDDPTTNQGFTIPEIGIVRAYVNDILVWGTSEDMKAKVNIPMEAKGLLRLDLKYEPELEAFLRKYKQQIEAMGLGFTQP